MILNNQVRKRKKNNSRKRKITKDNRVCKLKKKTAKIGAAVPPRRLPLARRLEKQQSRVQMVKGSTERKERKATEKRDRFKTEKVGGILDPQGIILPGNSTWNGRATTPTLTFTWRSVARNKRKFETYVKETMY